MATGVRCRRPVRIAMCTSPLTPFCAITALPCRPTPSSHLPTARSRRYANYVNAGQLLQVMPCLALFRRRDLAMQVLAIMRDVAGVWPMGLAAMRGAQRRYAQLAVLEAPSSSGPAWHAPAPPSYSLGGGDSSTSAASSAGAGPGGRPQEQPRPQQASFGAQLPHAPFPHLGAAPASAPGAPHAAAHLLPPAAAAAGAAAGGHHAGVVPRHRAASSASVFELGPSDFFPLGLATQSGAGGGGPGGGVGRGGGVGPGGMPPAGGGSGVPPGAYGGGGGAAGGGAGAMFPRGGGGGGASKSFPPLPLGGAGAGSGSGKPSGGFLLGGGGGGGASGGARMRVPSFDLPGDDADLLRGGGADSARLSVVAAMAPPGGAGRAVLDSPVPGGPTAPRGGPGGGSGGYSSVLQSPARVSDDVLEAAFWAT
jgi:hypothetical protein